MAFGGLWPCKALEKKLRPLKGALKAKRKKLETLANKGKQILIVLF
jgi:hypothetical protein